MGVAKINNEERGTEKEERKTKNGTRESETKKCSGNPPEKKLIGG